MKNIFNSNLTNIRSIKALLKITKLVSSLQKTTKIEIWLFPYGTSQTFTHSIKTDPIPLPTHNTRIFSRQHKRPHLYGLARLSFSFGRHPTISMHDLVISYLNKWLRYVFSGEQWREAFPTRNQKNFRL